MNYFMMYKSFCTLLHFKSVKASEQVTPPILYSDRWWIVISLALMNFASRGHVAALASVTNKCAMYYDQTGERIIMMFTISTFITAVSWFICSYAIEAFGLKKSIRVGGLMTLGGKIKFYNVRESQNFSILFNL